MKKAEIDVNTPIVMEAAMHSLKIELSESQHEALCRLCAEYETSQSQTIAKLILLADLQEQKKDFERTLLAIEEDRAEFDPRYPELRTP